MMESGSRGKGTFAIESISSGEIVIVQDGRVMTYGEMLDSAYRPFCNHGFQVERDLLICPCEPVIDRLDGIFLVNHSCDPTCGFRGQITLVALKDLSVGEEITYDYAMTDANYGSVTCAEMKCLCGSRHCRGIVTGEDWRSTNLQSRYCGYFSTFIQSLIEQETAEPDNSRFSGIAARGGT